MLLFTKQVSVHDNSEPYQFSVYPWAQEHLKVFPMLLHSVFGGHEFSVQPVSIIRSQCVTPLPVYPL